MEATQNKLRSVRSELLFSFIIVAFAIFLAVTFDDSPKFLIIISLILALFSLVRKWFSSDVLLFLLIMCLILEKYQYYIGFSIRLPMLILLILALVLFLRTALTAKLRFEVSQVHFLAVLLFIVYVLGTLTAIEPIRVIRVCLLYVFLFMLFFVLLHFLRTEDKIRKASLYFVAVGMIGALYGIYQIVGFIFTWPVDLPFIDYFSHHEKYNIGLTVFRIGGNLFPRINSTFNDPVLIGTYTAMSLMILISFMCARYARKNLPFKQAVIFVLGALLLLSCVVLTFSRSSWIGAFLGATVMAYYLFKNNKTRGALTALAIFFTIALVMAMIVFPSFKEMTIGRAMQTFDQGDISTSGHLKWLLIAIEAWADNPFFGVGLGNFGEYYAINYQAMTMAMTHSAYFSFLAETGAIGFTLEMILIVLIFRHLVLAISLARKSQDTDFYFLLIGLLSAYVVMLGANITYHFYTQFYVWFFNGLAVAASTYVIKRHTRE